MLSKGLPQTAIGEICPVFVRPNNRSRDDKDSAGGLTGQFPEKGFLLVERKIIDAFNSSDDIITGEADI